jgi:CubicO group peptidase (beta-lactamase class C family)
VEALAQIEAWQAPNAAAAVTSAERELGAYGDREHVFRWASVTKIVTALAALVAAEEGALDLDELAGPPGSSVRHLLAHASGLPFEGATAIARPGTRRIYSNSGYEALADHLSRRAGIPFAEYLRAAVLEPLGLGADLRGSAGSGLRGSLDDLTALARELLVPRLVAPETLAEMTEAQFPGLGGVLPGVGRFEPNDWGLGPELKDGKAPHWTGEANSARTFGHFGGAGTFLWVDPDAKLACACLTDREFGDWALADWPRLSDDVLAEAAV